jgi:hypothetical protein
VNADQRSRFAARLVDTFRGVVPESVRSLVPAPLRSASWSLLAGRSDAPEDDQWCRHVMNRDVHEIIDGLPPEKFDAIEISGRLRGEYPWHSYTRTRYPEFDLCGPTPPHETYSFVICEQVLEHTIDPWQAARTLYQLCRPGGLVLVNTPFLIRVHDAPVDYWRFTPDGLRVLLTGAGFNILRVRSWGNRSCVRANFPVWARYRRWHSLRNDIRVPVMVWALAERVE